MDRRTVILICLVASVLAGCSGGRGIPLTPPMTAEQFQAQYGPALEADRSAEPSEDSSAQPAGGAHGQPAALDKPTALTELVPEPTSIPATSTSNPAPRVGRQVVSSSALVVEGRVVSLEEIVRQAAPELQAIPKGLTQQAFSSRAAEILHQEIRARRDELLLLSEAQRHLTDQQKENIESQVERYLKDRLAEAGGSITRLHQELARQGTDLQQLREDYRKALMIETHLRDKLMPSLSVNRRMLLSYYRQNPGRFQSAKKVQMQLIAAPFRAFYPAGKAVPSDDEISAAKAQARQLIAQAAEALKGGEDFGEVARRLSRCPKADCGGLWEPMAKGSFRDGRLEEVAFALQEGQTSGIVETDVGFYIVKARAVMPARTVPFEQAQQEIETLLRDQQYLRLSEDYCRRLGDRASALYPPGLIESAVNRAVQLYWQP